jgi:hypothetical protein
MAKLTICVTADWEGESLEAANLEAMRAFRRQFQQIPLTHFICPAYLTRGGDLRAIAQRIREQIVPGDEVALHVHCWRTLVGEAGVKPVLKPTYYSPEFNDGNGPVVHFEGDKLDVGHGVPLGVYSPEEIAAILACARELLVAHRIAPEPPVAFRCGGWLASDPVLLGLEAAGFRLDSSATDARLLEEIDSLLRSVAKCRLGGWVKQLWGSPGQDQPLFLANQLSRADHSPAADALTQPYSIKIGDARVLEAPANGVLADYLTREEMLRRFEDAWNLAGGEDRVLLCGFHQESAARPNLHLQGTNLESFTKAVQEFLGNHPLQERIARGRGIVFNTVASLAKKRGEASARLVPPAAGEEERQEAGPASKPAPRPFPRFIG